ncbi:ELKS/Rab6-interacting/CAST family protein [Citrobacter youngae]|uniref:ELKS/Rab6-interacting/CAST family protein n=1 Tax=Citrobacter youngae TaxID=133448 RepID=UPI0021505A05|nr:ELKS/Rab6-interacting/CAST family protein [Citrobacter youngae]UUX52790.1 ELKS/Rab6-interacting/CAST family protein [Citrobacter youngae]
MSKIPWYLGQFDRRNYQSYLKAIAQETPDGWRTIENPKKLFPRTGEVEFNEADALPLRKGEWAAFHVGPGIRNRAQAKHARRIYPYYDLSSGQSLLEARRQLSFDGITTDGEPGLWAVRFGPDGLILASLAESKSGCLTLSRSQNVYEYDFREGGVISVSGISENGKLFYMPDVDASPARIHDWTPDKQYIEYVIQLLSCADSTAAIASWLRVHTNEQSGKLTSGVDALLAAAQTLRAGELAKKLEEEDSLTRQFTEAVLKDQHISRLLDHQIQNIAEEERVALRAEQHKALDKAFSAERLRRREAIETEMAAFDKTRKSEIEEEIAQLWQLEEEKLQTDFAKKKANIEQTLKQEKAYLESEISRLKDANIDLCAQNENQRQILASLACEHEAFLASLTDAEERTAQAQIELEKMDIAIAEKARRMAYSAIPEVRLPAQARVISCEEFGHTVRENNLLTSDGKLLMAQFLALMLAGECPLLYGPETQDFLAIAASLISSGRTIRQIADPTMITGEDLWFRAGNKMATPLYQGLLLSEAACPRTILAVIERVEYSAARFWLPALKDRLYGGDLPRRFLICGTIENEDCEEAEKLKEQHLRLRMENVVIQNAIVLSPLHLSSENHSELDPGAASQGSLPDKLAIADEISAGRLDLTNTLRAMRTAHEAVPLDDENKTHQKRLVDLYAGLQNNALCAQ